MFIDKKTKNSVYQYVRFAKNNYLCNIKLTIFLFVYMRTKVLLVALFAAVCCTQMAAQPFAKGIWIKS